MDDVPEVKWLGKKDLGLELPNTKWPLSDLCQFLQGGPGALGTPYRERAVDTVLGPVYPLFWERRRRPEGAVLVMRFLHSKAKHIEVGRFWRCAPVAAARREAVARLGAVLGGLDVLCQLNGASEELGKATRVPAMACRRPYRERHPVTCTSLGCFGT